MLAMVRSKDARAVFTKAAEVDVPVRMTASRSCGYLVVTPFVTVEPPEWPTPTTFLNDSGPILDSRRRVMRAWATSTCIGPCTTWLGSGCSDLPTPMRSYEKVA